jgi:mono/diheme cytochrome c family protein
MVSTSLKIWSAGLVLALAGACGTADDRNDQQPTRSPGTADRSVLRDDAGRGDVDRDLAERGRSIHEANCQRCHGAGTADGDASSFHTVGQQRDRDWLMSFVTNSELPAGDRGSSVRYDECAVREPGQTLDHEEARQVVEYIRSL